MLILILLMYLHMYHEFDISVYPDRHAWRHARGIYVDHAGGTTVVPRLPHHMISLLEQEFSEKMQIFR